MSKSPAFQFYPQDWMSDKNVVAMTAEEEGHYIRLVCMCWIEGGIPADVEEIKLCLKGGSQMVEANLYRVLKCFVKNPKNEAELIHPRLQKEREKQEKWREKSAKGGRKKQQNRIDMKNGTGLVQPMAYSSSSSSSSSSNKHKNILSKIDRDQLFEEAWAVYPVKNGKAKARGHFNASVSTPEDAERLRVAMDNYFHDVKKRRDKGFRDLQCQYGCTWFKTWREEWLDKGPYRYRNPEEKKAAAKEVEETLRTDIAEFLRGGREWYDGDGEFKSRQLRNIVANTVFDYLKRLESVDASWADDSRESLNQLTPQEGQDHGKEQGGAE